MMIDLLITQYLTCYSSLALSSLQFALGGISCRRFNKSINHVVGGDHNEEKRKSCFRDFDSRGRSAGWSIAVVKPQRHGQSGFVCPLSTTSDRALRRHQRLVNR